MNENIIILTDGESYETWGSLVKLCKAHNLSYNWLKTKKFPFKYKGMRFIKTPFSEVNGVVFGGIVKLKI
jgi:hypothetical protein